LEPREINIRFKDKFESHTRKTLNRFATKDSYKLLGTSHITGKVPQSETSTLSEEDHRWFKRRSRGEEACDKRQQNN
jgi:hypothetical protein